MSLDNILNKLQDAETYIKNKIEDEDVSSGIASRFDDIYDEVAAIQDELIELQHIISKLAY